MARWVHSARNPLDWAWRKDDGSAWLVWGLNLAAVEILGFLQWLGHHQYLVND